MSVSEGHSQVGAEMDGALAPKACRMCPVRADSFCAELGPAELARLEAMRSEIAIDPPRLLVQEGDPAVGAYNVTSGVLRLVKLLSDGRRQIIGFLFPGSFFGFAAKGRHQVSVEAVTPARLCRYHLERLVALAGEIPALEGRFLRIAAEELEDARAQMVLLGRKTARERLASFLLWMSRRAERHGLPPSPVELPMSRSDIADYLGLTIETVSRTLTQLGRDGVIDFLSTTRIALADRAALEALDAGEDARH